MVHYSFMTNYPGAGQISTGFHQAMTRLKAALLVACLLFGLPTLALAQSTSAAAESGTGINIASVKAQVEGLKLELNQIEAGLERRSLSTELLGVQRQRLDDIGIQLRKFGDELNPRAESLRSRIKELGPEPDSKSTPESPEIAKDRADRDRALKEVDELIKITRSAALQASQLVDLVVEKRRDAFQAHLFERTSSLLAPGRCRIGVAQRYFGFRDPLHQHDRTDYRCPWIVGSGFFADRPSLPGRHHVVDPGRDPQDCRRSFS